MGRFLIYFSYFGTRYSGVQEQRGLAVKTVGGALMTALKHLQPSNEIKLTLSSRTDKGVHALANACHVDLVYPFDGKEYNPSVITSLLNYYLMNQQEEIRILQTKQVPETFNCRHSATGRKYVYRLGHILGSGFKSALGSQTDGSEALLEELQNFTHSKFPKRKRPLGEALDAFNASKAVIYRTELDIRKLVAAAEMLSGIHNYLCFTCHRKEDDDNLPHPVKMLTIGVKRGQPLGHRFQKYSSCLDNNIEFWDIHVQSKSFMYKQVRRLVGAMVLVAKNAISLSDLQDILENPRKEFPFAGQMSAREDGLFLLDVDYSSNDLEISGSVQTDSVSEQPELSHDDDDVSVSCGGSHHGDGVTTTRPGGGAADSEQIAGNHVMNCLSATQTDSTMASSSPNSQEVSLSG
ncbi:unnamed protein product [Candidula unifasciata]|uniref:tRNA pseudouridine synthase n=1 Tax=Candidula unifasciata TaxID=100452 RepID=A0A8S3ZL36_9EUPU|nr:unnamed protein product [Candidula unifasciata]